VRLRRKEVARETLRGVVGELDDLLEVVERPYGITGPDIKKARLPSLTFSPPEQKMVVPFDD